MRFTSSFSGHVLCMFLCTIIFYFLLPMHRRELFWGQFFEMEILMDLHVLRSLEFENYIFRGCCVCVCLYCITAKQIMAETPNLLFYICIICIDGYMKLFKKIRQIVCIQGHTKEFENITVYGRNFFLMQFKMFRLH